jgi:excisionase family DNA binding protein
MPIELGGITLFSVAELAQRLDVTPMTLRTYFKEGRIQARKVGGKWYCSEEALRNFFLGQEDKVPAWKRRQQARDDQE